MKTWQIILLTILILLTAAGVYLYAQVRSVAVEQLSEDLWVLRGLGGNTAVLRTDAGAVVVDTMTFGIQGERIREIATALTGTEPVMVINTHYHFDHTHGNPAFKPGTRVLSTERTRLYLEVLDGEFWQTEGSLKPNETFTDRQSLDIGGKQLELVHPGAGHTNGDLVVLFRDEGVVHMGDLLFNQHYPNIDLEAGGSVQQWPATLDRVLQLNFDRVIPGHGATTDRIGLRQFQTFIAELGTIARQAASEAWSLEEMLATEALMADANYEPVRFVVSLGLNRAFVLQRAWEETTNNFTPVNIEG